MSLAGEFIQDIAVGSEHTLVLTRSGNLSRSLLHLGCSFHCCPDCLSFPINAVEMIWATWAIWAAINTALV